MTENKIDFRNPAKMATNARCIAKTAWRLYEESQRKNEDINSIYDVIDFTPELEWRPQGKEWNPLELYLRTLIRSINKKVIEGGNGARQKADVAATFTGLGLIYNFDIKLDSKGGVVNKVFIYDEGKAPSKLLHTININ